MEQRAELIAEALRAEGATLRAFVRARVAPGEVDDLLQHVALRAVERAHTLRDPARVMPWLYRLHRNAIVDLARQRGSQKRLETALAPEDASPPEPESCKCSLVQARTLRETHASILSLVEVEGRTLSEAAAHLGISVNSATVRLHRARKALRERLFEHCGVRAAGDCSDCRCVYEGCCAA